MGCLIFDYGGYCCITPIYARRDLVENELHALTDFILKNFVSLLHLNPMKGWWMSQDESGNDGDGVLNTAAFTLHPGKSSGEGRLAAMLPGTYFDESSQPPDTADASVRAAFSTPESNLRVNLAAEQRTGYVSQMAEAIIEMFEKGSDVISMSNHTNGPYNTVAPVYLSSSSIPQPEDSYFLGSSSEQQALDSGMSVSSDTPLVSDKLLGAVIRPDDWRTAQSTGVADVMPPQPYSSAPPMRNATSAPDSYFQLNMSTNPRLFDMRQLNTSNKDLLYPNSLGTGVLDPDLRIPYTQQPNQAAGVPIFNVPLPTDEQHKFPSLVDTRHYDNIGTMHGADHAGVPASSENDQYTNIGELM